MRGKILQLAREKQFCGAIALIKNGEAEAVVRASFGDANPALSLPNTPETQFNIGSIGKMFTAIAIVQLVKDGKLTYDKPIRESLSKLSHCPPYHAAIFSTLDFTPHELLTHTAGLNDRAGKIYEDSLGPDMLLFARVEDYFHHFALKDAVTPETRGTHRYSNLGYDLLGLAIEAITGDYYEYVKNTVFIPAGMANTVPTRAPGGNFSLPTLTAPSLPNPAPQWLVDLSRDESDTRLSRDAHFAIMMLADIRKITEERDKLSADILTDYQQLSRLSPTEYPQFRTALIEKINLLQEITLQTREKSEELVKLIRPVCERLHKQWAGNPDTDHDEHLQKMQQLDIFMMETLIRHTVECQQLNCFLNSLSIAHPAGCWYSTIDNLVAFDRSLQNGNLSTYRQALVNNPVSCGGDSKYGYGCALVKPVNDPLHNLGHTGGVPGGLANYSHYPNAGYTLVMLSNEDHPDHIFGFAREIEAAMKLSMESTVGNQSSFFQKAPTPSEVSRTDKKDDEAMRFGRK